MAGGRVMLKAAYSEMLAAANSKNQKIANNLSVSE